MKDKPKNEHELTKLEDDDLIEYAVACRDSGDDTGFFLAINVFVAGRAPMVRARVGAKVPAEDVEDVVSEAICSAISSISGIRGSSTGEVVNWLKRITQFRIADYFRGGENDPEFSHPGGQGDDENWMEIFVDHADEIGEIEIIDAIDRVLDRRNEVHRMAIELRIDGYSSKEAAEEINLRIDEGLLEPGKPMTNSNVDQIMKRFREELIAELGWEQEK